MYRISEWINEVLGISNVYQSKIVLTILVIILLILFKNLILRLLFTRSHDLKTRYKWRKSSTHILYGLIVLLVIPIWFDEFRHFGTFLGLFTAGLAIALKDPVSNFFGWVYIIVRKPFEMGERIQIAEYSGDVIDIGFFQITMLEIRSWVDADQSTGRVVYIPNGMVFTKPVQNFNQAMNHIWHEIPVRITFESNWQEAKRILLSIANTKLARFGLSDKDQIRKAENRFTIKFANLTPTVYTSIRDNGILMTLRYLCRPQVRRGSEQVAMEAILDAFQKHPDIHFAYPTTRIYRRDEENREMSSGL